MSTFLCRKEMCRERKLKKHKDLYWFTQNELHLVLPHTKMDFTKTKVSFYIKTTKTLQELKTHNVKLSYNSATLKRNTILEAIQHNLTKQK